MQKRIPVDTALNETGLKKKYIAEKLGVTPGYLNVYLANPEEISIKNAAIICELTGKSMSELDFNVSSK